MTQPNNERRPDEFDDRFDPLASEFAHLPIYIPDDPRTLCDFVPEWQYNILYNMHMDKYSNTRSTFRLPQWEPDCRPFKPWDPSTFVLEQKAAIFDMLYANGIRELEHRDCAPRDYPSLQYILSANMRDASFHLLFRLLQGVVSDTSIRFRTSY